MKVLNNINTHMKTVKISQIFNML